MFDESFMAGRRYLVCTVFGVSIFVTCTAVPTTLGVYTGSDYYERQAAWDSTFRR